MDFETTFFSSPIGVHPEDIDVRPRLGYWQSKRAFLLSRGLNLYQLSSPRPSMIYCYPPCNPNAGGTLPYAIYEDSVDYDVMSNIPAFRFGTRGVVVPAVDELNRHVTLKLIKNGSSEYKTLRRIMSLQARSAEGILSGLVPVLELIPMDAHWVAIMPRWSGQPVTGWFCSVKELLFCVEELLNGLVVLHSQRIVHRDLAPHNCLTNYVPAGPNRIDIEDPANAVRQLQSSHSLRYGWIDYGFSVPLPLEIPLSLCRFSWQASVPGAWDIPYDVSQGEYIYDPFAFDVGTLGIFFCAMCQHLTPQIPLLAPFLDRMVTRDISSRFTAAAALDFVHHIQETLSEKELEQPCELPGYEERDYETFDRWRGLPDTFIAQWGHMREPSRVPVWTRVLRFACGYMWIEGAVRYYRRAVDYILGHRFQVLSVE
ncbi:hypothetical protein HMN09_01335200 [Mycena chlorophos]|uniref:Protein kinase domain-containing protein n=1 Tax=Mycena chlorophos TaxID=658473 RepID=A0A8H6RYW9_MYCCL|nr:hypothetical protein HMN09_01335200 [Mycena chlorophos]